MMSYLHLKRKALFLSRLSRREEAIENALISLAGFRWNWSAWTLLGSCIGDGEEVVSFRFFFLYLSLLTFSIVNVSPPTTSACSRPSTNSLLSNKNIKRTSQSVWAWTTVMWPLARAWFFPQQPLDYELESMCSISSPRCVHITIFFYNSYLDSPLVRFWPSWSSVWTNFGYWSKSHRRHWCLLEYPLRHR